MYLHILIIILHYFTNVLIVFKANTITGQMNGNSGISNKDRDKYKDKDKDKD